MFGNGRLPQDLSVFFQDHVLVMFHGQISLQSNIAKEGLRKDFGDQGSYLVHRTFIHVSSKSMFRTLPCYISSTCSTLLIIYSIHHKLSPADNQHVTSLQAYSECCLTQGPALHITIEGHDMWTGVYGMVVLISSNGKFSKATTATRHFYFCAPTYLYTRHINSHNFACGD